MTFAHNQKLMTYRIILPLPFHNIKCRGNHAFLKLFRPVFNFYAITFWLVYIFPHLRPNDLNVSILGYVQKHVYAWFYIFFLLRSFTEGGISNFWNNKQSHENTILAGRAMCRVIYALRDAQIMYAWTIIGVTLLNSPNPSRVYIRLCKHGKRFLLLRW